MSEGRRWALAAVCIVGVFVVLVAAMVGIGVLRITTDGAEAEEPPQPWCQRVNELRTIGRPPDVPRPGELIRRSRGEPSGEVWTSHVGIYKLEFRFGAEGVVPEPILRDGEVFVTGLERIEAGEEPTAEQIAAADRLSRRLEECPG